MIILTSIENKEWSNRIRRRGIRAVAKEMGVDPGYISRVVNNQIAVTDSTLERLRVATNNLKPKERPVK